MTRPPAMPAWRRHGETMPGATAGASGRLAIVIDDLGLSRLLADKAIALPGAVTLAFLPYAEGLPAMARAARERGHELLVHVPMQPKDPTVDAGPGALRVDQDAATLRAHLNAALGSFDGHVGINNHMGSRFTEATGPIETVLRELQARGLMFLDSRTTPHSAAPRLAAGLRVPFAQRDVFLDNSKTPADIAANLDKAAAIARKTGEAIAIGHPYPETLAVLAEWLPYARDKGVVLVPITAVTRVPAAGDNMARAVE